MDSLKKLEYRGYDSAGIVTIDNGIVNIVKTKGQIGELEKIINDLKGHNGIAHTRWATHGKPSNENAHPFKDCNSRFALVHNGIIENFMELREGLIKEGHEFTSETDTEVMVHLIEKFYEGDFEDAVRKMLSAVKGAFAFVVLNAERPDELIAARTESPIIIGLGEGENFVASDVPALLKETNKVIYVHNHELAVLSPSGVRVTAQHHSRPNIGHGPFQTLQERFGQVRGLRDIVPCCAGGKIRVRGPRASTDLCRDGL
jgi:glucosamine--fructose-6-phosphate aminotransferase (isomerizing)